MNVIDEILDKLWAAGVTIKNAESILEGLSTDQADDLEAFLKKAGLLNFTPHQDTSEEISMRQALFLAAMAKHHSDSIVSLPEQLRKERMQSLATDIGVPNEAVQLAVRLGPVGIERHVAEVQE